MSSSLRLSHWRSRKSKSLALSSTLTGPIGGVLLDGNKEGKDIDFQQSRTDIKAQWSAFEDTESDVIKITWCAGFSSGACNLVRKTELDLDTEYILKDLMDPITNGRRFFITVTATNSAGMTTSVTSDGVTVDDTAPIPGIVIDGSVLDLDYVNGEDDISASWVGFQDLESGLMSYSVALCDARNWSSCPHPFTGVGQATNVTLTGSMKSL